MVPGKNHCRFCLKMMSGLYTYICVFILEKQTIGHAIATNNWSILAESTFAFVWICKGKNLKHDAVEGGGWAAGGGNQVAAPIDFCNTRN